ncbi:MAG: AAA family ATPase, partial [Bacteroidetes Order II. Incertae sedis bacterium]|nr:AAA family ATPase [Bacteroidetes Order II. bacterium]
MSDSPVSQGASNIDSNVTSELAERFGMPALSPRAKSRPNLPTSFTAADLEHMNIPSPTFLMPGVIPQGCTVLAGKPKSGKTLFALGLAVAVARGEQACGALSVKKGAVLYVAAEGSVSDFKNRLPKILNGKPGPHNLHFKRDVGIGSDVVDMVAEWLSVNSDAGLVVIDTLVKVSDTKHHKGAYRSSYEDVYPWTALAEEYNVSILIITHLRKAPTDNLMDGISGGIGGPAAADTQIVVLRNGDKLQMYSEGRNLGLTESVFRFDKESLTWIFEGAPVHEESTDIRRQIVRVMRESKKESMTPKEVSDLMGGDKYDSIRQAMPKMDAD